MAWGHNRWQFLIVGILEGGKFLEEIIKIFDTGQFEILDCAHNRFFHYFLKIQLVVFKLVGEFIYDPVGFLASLLPLFQ